jgi:two-component system cell cycle sensor histidine kinase PleC
MTEYVAHIGQALLRQRAAPGRANSEVVNKVRAEFLSTMSHELRTPLNTVIGFSKILADHRTRPLDDKEIVEYATIIHDAAKQLLSVINDVLDMSRIQAGRYNLDRRDVNLDEVLHSITIAFAPAATRAGLTLRHDISPELRPVRGDPAKLRQIFGNILSNAIKFSAAGGTVAISASQSANHAVVSIHDTGVGMGADDLTIALTPFGQVDGSPTRSRDGTGLGLPIANALTLLHGGQLKIASTPSCGTEVTVILPSTEAGPATG